MEKYFGLFLIIISLIISSRFIEEFKVLKDKKEIEVTVTEVPIDCHSRRKGLKAYFKFEYLGKSYTKNIKGKINCELIKPKVKINLLTNNDNTVFLFPDENIITELASTIIIILIGVFMIFKKRIEKLKRLIFN